MPKKAKEEKKMNVSAETKIMQSISSMFDFTSTHTRSRIIEANRRKMIAGIELNENQIAALNNLIEASIKEAFIKSSNEVTVVVKTLEL